MNIFILDNNPELAAEMHCDKHVNKMILESAQMLCTVLGGPYKPTHKNHPCTLWVGQSQYNARWLWTLACFLNWEYKIRYGKDVDHKSWEVIEPMQDQIYSLPDVGPTPFALAMPDEYKTNRDPVQAYRAYYKSKPFASWEKGREQPDWW